MRLAIAVPPVAMQALWAVPARGAKGAGGIEKT